MLLLAEVPNLKCQHRHETVRAVSEILSFPPAGWWRSHRPVCERCSRVSTLLCLDVNDAARAAWPWERGRRFQTSVCVLHEHRAPEPCSVKYVLLLSLNTGFCANNSFVYTTPDLYVMFMLVIYLTCLLSKVPQAPLYFEIRNSMCHLFLY